MPLTTKYIPVLKLLEELKAWNISSEEIRGQLVIRGTVKSEKDRDLVLRKISQINRDEATDVNPQINVEIQF